MEWLKSLLARWKVQISIVGGALVVATAYGTCTLEPPVEEVSENAPDAEAVEATTTIEVSAETSTEEANSPTPATETTTATETETE
jgi:hypothetical protein